MSVLGIEFRSSDLETTTFPCLAILPAPVVGFYIVHFSGRDHYGIVVKSLDWDLTLSLSFMPLDRLFNISKPQLPRLLNGTVTLSTHPFPPQVCSTVFWNTEIHLALATLSRGRTNKLKLSVSIKAFGHFEGIS